MTKASDQIIDLYRRHAHAWTKARASQRGPLMEASWLDRFVGLLPHRRAVLDIGCGSGEPVSRYLAEQACDITGVDSAPEMIALCTAHFPQQNWHVADMRSLALGRTFDGILAWDSFFHLSHDDQRLMFPIFRTHSAAHAVLMFTSGPNHGEAIGNLEGEPLFHASLSSDEYGDLLTQNGFEVLAHAVEDPTYGRHTVWLAQRS